MGLVKNVAGFLKSGQEYLLLDKVNGDEESYRDLIAGTREHRDRGDFRNTAAREVWEETGYRPSMDEIFMARPYIMRISPSYFHVRPFMVEVDEKPEIRISDEHEGYEWATEDALNEELDDSRFFNLRYVEEAADGNGKIDDPEYEIPSEVLNMKILESEEDIDKIIQSLG